MGQVFGRKKNATAVAHIKAGKGLVKVNGRPLSVLKPEILRIKIEEPIRLLGKARFNEVDIRVRVSGGGKTARSTPSARRSPRAWLRTTRSTSTRPASARSRTSSFRSTAFSSLPTRAAAAKALGWPERPHSLRQVVPL